MFIGYDEGADIPGVYAATARWKEYLQIRQCGLMKSDRK